MKTGLAIIILLVAVALAAPAAMASAQNWLIYMQPTQSGVPVPLQSGPTSVFGCTPTAHSGVGSEDQLAPFGMLNIVATDLGNNYIQDLRSPLAPGGSTTWNLVLSYRPALESTVTLNMWNPGSADYDGSFPLRIVRGRTTLVDWDPNEDSYTLTFVASPSGGQIDLQMVAGPMVPEPLSAAAILLGVIGLVGWKIR